MAKSDDWKDAIQDLREHINKKFDAVDVRFDRMERLILATADHELSYEELKKLGIEASPIPPEIGSSVTTKPESLAAKPLGK